MVAPNLTVISRFTPVAATVEVLKATDETVIVAATTEGVAWRLVTVSIE